MSKQVITLSDRAAERVKEIIAQAKEPIIGVRVGVTTGGMPERIDATSGAIAGSIRCCSN